MRRAGDPIFASRVASTEARNRALATCAYCTKWNALSTPSSATCSAENSPATVM